MIINSWIPKSLKEYALFLEDDVEVSPYFFVYILKTLSNFEVDHLSNSSFQDNIAGISLFNPNLNQMYVPPKWFKPFLFPSDDLLNCPFNLRGQLFLLDVPCSWGALYFPNHWINFRLYSASNSTALLYQNKTLASEFWTRSWKKVFIRYMQSLDLTVIYPYLDYGFTFATHHMETGEHAKTSPDQLDGNNLVTLKYKTGWFTPPLLRESIFKIPINDHPCDKEIKFSWSNFLFPNPGEITRFDVWHQKR